MKSICFVIPYFGKLPNYFNMFLQTCANNPTINFQIYTDDRREFNYSNNVKVFYTTLEEVKNRLQRLFDFPIILTTPYKLCDYKVCYGEAFEEELTGYDFWGYCDIDLIWGNIRKFLSDEILNQFNRILTRGHCSVFRNTKECNTWFKNLPSVGCQDYQLVYQSEKGYAFDEWAGHMGGGLSEIIKRNGIPQYDELVYADINAFTNHFELTRVEEKQKYISVQCKKEGLFVFWLNQDRIQSREYMYCHFQKKKILQDGCEFQKEFMFVEPGKFIEMFEPNQISVTEYKKKVYFKGLNTQLISLRWNQVKKKMGWK